MYRLLRHDRLLTILMMGFLGIVLIFPVLLAAGLSIKSAGIFQNQNLWELLFSTQWQPVKGEFGFGSYILSSVIVTILAILIAVPVCLLSSIYLTFYARPWLLRVMQPVTDILAGIPSIIYGVWGILVIIPLISDAIAPLFGVSTPGYSILAGAMVLAVMIIPFILNIQIEILRSIPGPLAEASMSLGAGYWQTIKFVMIRKAAPGIISSVVFGLSRAFGETIAVLMVVGNVARIPSGLLDPGYPLPALIANNYGEMLSIPSYDSALMFGALILLVVVLLFNLAARWLIRRFEIHSF